MTLDEMIAVLQAYKEGKKIECLQTDGEWMEIPDPHWNFTICSYRIKSEPHHRPFANAEELMAEMKEHGDWIKSVKNSRYGQILSADGYGIDTYVIGYEKYQEAFEKITFADGAPFGVKEE